MSAETQVAGGGGLGREIRRLSTQTLVYGIGGVALQLVGVITLPIFARVFSPADYGILELGMTAAAILMIVVDGGMASASQRSYFDYGDADEAPRRRVLNTALPLFAAAQFSREVLRLEFRPWAYLVASVAAAAVGATVSILAVVTWDLG